MNGKGKNKALGGYFELELPPLGSALHAGAHKFQSARAAFYALLLSGKPTRVWVPRYICGAMLAPLEKAGIECVFYSVNERFEIFDDVVLKQSDWLLYVNYFGLCGRVQKGVLKKYNPDQVVIDNSQAFFAASESCLATIYSPRKFFGVPDGGVLITSRHIDVPEEMDVTSIGRMSHLIKRLAFEPENGYVDYQLAEEGLKDFQLQQMSVLTRKILCSIDYDVVRKKRNDNFAFLHAHLGGSNKLRNLDLQDAPLCYPYWVTDPALRKRLIEKRVYVATYWPEVLSRVSSDSIEASWVNGLLPLPCDQRYSAMDMQLIIEIVKNG